MARPGSRPFLESIDRAKAAGHPRKREKRPPRPGFFGFGVFRRRLAALRAEPVTWATLRRVDPDVAALARNMARRYGYPATDPGEADDPRDAGLAPVCEFDADARWTCRLAPASS